MKKHILLFLAISFAAMASAQTQQGYVKTKGRMVNGKLVPGQGLKGATVSVHGRTAVLVNKDNGAFSFPVPEAQFRIDSVRKKGYQLVDMDALSKTYKHSANPIYLVMETPEQQMEDQIDNFNKINASQQAMINKLRVEIKQLKEQNKISEEEYRKRLVVIAEMQSENQSLINEMAERYSKIDFDQLDDFNRQVSWLILDGELFKADSLIKSKGNMEERSVELDRIHKANAEEAEKLIQRQENLENSKKFEAKQLEDFASDCYNLHEICILKHNNDSASYWIELIASKDTTNVKWQNDAGSFIQDYIADYEKALSYYNRALRQSMQQCGELSDWTGSVLNNIGNIYEIQGNYDKALEYHNKALDSRKTALGEQHPDVASSFNNIGIVYRKQGDYDKALEYYIKALNIREAVLGEQHPDVATNYDNIGNVYSDQGDINKALEYYIKALNIRKAVLGEQHPDVATSYINTGTAFGQQGDYDKALEHFDIALNILKTNFGENHPFVANCYNNIGIVYRHKDNYDKANEYNFKALNIQIAIFGEKHFDVASSYNNIGIVFAEQSSYDDALEYFNKALNTFEAIFGENHPLTATCHYNIGSVYQLQCKYDKAYEHINKTLSIRKAILGDEHPSTIKTQQKLSELQSKLKAQENQPNE